MGEQRPDVPKPDSPIAKGKIDPSIRPVGGGDWKVTKLPTATKEDMIVANVRAVISDASRETRPPHDSNRIISNEEAVTEAISGAQDVFGEDTANEALRKSGINLDGKRNKAIRKAKSHK